MSSLSAFLTFGLVLACVSPALAWGPLTHAVFNCLSLLPNVPVADCIQNSRHAQLFLGTAMPDAFAFGTFNLTVDPANTCKDLTYVHDPVFAGEMIRYAMNISSQPGFQASDSFDPVEFSKGYAGHILGDLVGFFPAGGFLCGSETTGAGCATSSVLWVPQWSMMTAVDAYLYHNYSLHQTLPTTGSLHHSVIQFISDASYHYKTIDETFVPVTFDTVKRCAAYWADNMEFVFKHAKFISSDPANVDYVRRQISDLAPIHSQTGRLTKIFANGGDTPITQSWTLVKRYLTKQRNCALGAIESYFRFLLDEHQTPAQAITNTVGVVTNLYTDGFCTL